MQDANGADGAVGQEDRGRRQLRGEQGVDDHVGCGLVGRVASGEARARALCLPCAKLLRKRNRPTTACSIESIVVGVIKHAAKHIHHEL